MIMNRTENDVRAGAKEAMTYILGFCESVLSCFMDRCVIARVRWVQDGILMQMGVARQIRDADSASIVSQLLFLEAEEASKPIHLYINSPGAGLSVCGSRLRQTI